MRALCALAAACGMWAEHIDTKAAPAPEPRKSRPAPKLTRPGARKPFDPGIDFTESEW